MGMRWLLFPFLVFIGELYNFAPNDLLWLGAVIGFLLLLPLLSRWVGLGGYRELGLLRHPGWGRELLLGAFVGLCVGAAAWTLEWFLVGAAVRVNLWALLPGLLTIVVGSILGALVEEVLFRGYLVRILPATWPTHWVVAAGALLFAAGHYHRWFNRPLDHFLFLAVIGVAFVLPAAMRRSLWLGIGLHVGHNLGVNLLRDRAAFQVTQPPLESWVAGQTDLLLAAMMIPLAYWLSRSAHRLDAAPGRAERSAS